jgi:hypothetical protein
MSEVLVPPLVNRLVAVNLETDLDDLRKRFYWGRFHTSVGLAIAMAKAPVVRPAAIFLRRGGSPVNPFPQ